MKFCWLKSELPELAAWVGEAEAEALPAAADPETLAEADVRMDVAVDEGDEAVPVVVAGEELPDEDEARMPPWTWAGASLSDSPAAAVR